MSDNTYTVAEVTINIQYLVIRDVRLEGSKPNGSEVLEVDANTPIAWPIAWIRERCAHYSDSIVKCRLLAHGFEPKTKDGFTIFGHEFNATYSQGGGGILFCKECISLETIPQFGAIKGMLSILDIFACGAAYITPGSGGGYGDGNVLCSRLAQTMGSYVRASTATQYYNKNHCEFGGWEGDVYTYGPAGNVANVQHAPLT